MKKSKKVTVWIISFFLFFSCSGPNNKLIFWNETKDYVWDEYFVNHSLENNSFSFFPSFLLIHAKSLDYPFLEWVLPYYKVYRPTTSKYKNAIKLGACLADLSYLALYEKNLWLNNYRNYADSLRIDIFDGYQLPEFYNSYSEKFDSLLLWVSAQLGSLDIITKTLDNNFELCDFVYFGAWLETLFIVSHVASSKEDVALFLHLAEHKKYLFYYQDHLKKKLTTKFMGNAIDWISHQLAVTQTVNVWDSVENQFYLKTIPLKEPIINLLKNISELREKWILKN